MSALVQDMFHFPERFSDIAEFSAAEQFPTEVRKVVGKHKNAFIAFSISYARAGHGDQFADRIAQGGKFFFILCHDVSLTKGLIVMQIVRDSGQLPLVAVFDCLHRIVKESPIVGLKFQPALPVDDLPVSGQEIRGKSAAFWHGGPWARDRKSSDKCAPLRPGQTAP